MHVLVVTCGINLSRLNGDLIDILVPKEMFRRMRPQVILFRWAFQKLRATPSTSRQSSSPSPSNFAIVPDSSFLHWCQNNCRYCS